MRDTNDRRQPHATSPYPVDDNPQQAAAAERRKIRDRRMENLSLEERQLLLSEMPALPPESG
ncbi:MAG: hypothetical protein WBP44_08160 [Gammaproteobacteria bacterium]|jgi:hypothetical protein